MAVAGCHPAVPQWLWQIEVFKLPNEMWELPMWKESNVHVGGRRSTDVWTGEHGSSPGSLWWQGFAATGGAGPFNHNSQENKICRRLAWWLQARSIWYLRCFFFAAFATDVRSQLQALLCYIGRHCRAIKGSVDWWALIYGSIRLFVEQRRRTISVRSECSLLFHSNWVATGRSIAWNEICGRFAAILFCVMSQLFDKDSEKHVFSDFWDQREIWFCLLASQESE